MFPDRHSRRGNQTVSVTATSDEDTSGDDVAGDGGYSSVHDDDDPCGHDDCDYNYDDVRRSKRDHPPERPQIHDVRGEYGGDGYEIDGKGGECEAEEEEEKEYK